MVQYPLSFCGTNLFNQGIPIIQHSVWSWTWKGNAWWLYPLQKKEEEKKRMNLVKACMLTILFAIHGFGPANPNVKHTLCLMQPMNMNTHMRTRPYPVNYKHIWEIKLAHVVLTFRHVRSSCNLHVYYFHKHELLINLMVFIYLGVIYAQISCLPFFCSYNWNL